MKKLLTNYSAAELTEMLGGRGLPKYRATQLHKWLCLGAGFDDMTDLPKAAREDLAAEYISVGARIETLKKSKDGTVKFLCALSDGEYVESVLMSYKYGYTLCVSTQVGCRMGCVFCASGFNGKVRDLSAGEMLGQIIAANGYLHDNNIDARVTNVVLMGSGEPMDNYDNVTRFIRLAHEYLSIGQRSISLSTCGLVPGIRRLADDGYGVTLCVSLHATTDDARKKIMPIANKYPISEIISAAKYYFEKSGRRVLFEYATISGQNTSQKDAERLRRLTADFPTHINLIPLNDTGSNLKGTSRDEAKLFCSLLTTLGASATVRRSLATDIDGACGQLRNQFVGDLKGKN